jgi:putative transcriptional regulator
MAIRIAINDLLEERGKSAYWLAQETGLSHTVIGKLRHGQNQSINLEYLDLICTALDCGVEDILVREEKKGPRRPTASR